MSNFQQSNFGQQNQQTQPSNEKTNFAVTKIYGNDGILSIGIWKSQTSIFTIIQIKQSVGKDPTTGAMVLEQKAPNEIPRVFMNAETLCYFIEGLKCGKDFSVPKLKKGSELSVSGVGTNSVKITIKEEKFPQPRVITFDSVPIGDSNVCGGTLNILRTLEPVVMRKVLYAKMDPNEFNIASNISEEDVM